MSKSTFTVVEVEKNMPEMTQKVTLASAIGEIIEVVLSYDFAVKIGDTISMDTADFGQPVFGNTLYQLSVPPYSMQAQGKEPMTDKTIQIVTVDSSGTPTVGHSVIKGHGLHVHYVEQILPTLSGTPPKDPSVYLSLGFGVKVRSGVYRVRGLSANHHEIRNLFLVLDSNVAAGGIGKIGEMLDCYEPVQLIRGHIPVHQPTKTLYVVSGESIWKLDHVGDLDQNVFLEWVPKMPNPKGSMDYITGIYDIIRGDDDTGLRVALKGLWEAESLRIGMALSDLTEAIDCPYHHPAGDLSFRTSVGGVKVDYQLLRMNTLDYYEYTEKWPILLDTDLVGRDMLQDIPEFTYDSLPQPTSPVDFGTSGIDFSNVEKNVLAILEAKTGIPKDWLGKAGDLADGGYVSNYAIQSMHPAMMQIPKMKTVLTGKQLKESFKELPTGLYYDGYRSQYLFIPVWNVTAMMFVEGEIKSGSITGILWNNPILTLQSPTKEVLLHYVGTDCPLPVESGTKALRFDEILLATYDQDAHEKIVHAAYQDKYPSPKAKTTSSYSYLAHTWGSCKSGGVPSTDAPKFLKEGYFSLHVEDGLEILSGAEQIVADTKGEDLIEVHLRTTDGWEYASAPKWDPLALLLGAALHWLPDDKFKSLTIVGMAGASQVIVDKGKALEQLEHDYYHPPEWITGLCALCDNALDGDGDCTEQDCEAWFMKNGPPCPNGCLTGTGHSKPMHPVAIKGVHECEGCGAFLKI